MNDFQVTAFKWAGMQPIVTGAVIFLLGLVYNFQGFRMFRFLMAISAGAIAFLIPWMVDLHSTFPTTIVALALAALAVLGTILRHKPSVALVNVVTFAALAHYLCQQLGFNPTVVWIGSGLGALFGALFLWVDFEAASVVLTAVHGAILMVLGFVALTSEILPSLGGTFRTWASSQSLVVPVLIGMLVVTGYSYQVLNKRGDMRSGV